MRRPTSPRTSPQNDVPAGRGLAEDGIPVAVTCGVLGFSRQAYYACWPTRSSDRDWDDAHAVHALRQAHQDDPEFGYRPLADGLTDAAIVASENRVHRPPPGQPALHTVVVSRIRWPDQRTIDYVTRRNPNGEFKADLDTIRRLKRYVARELFPVIIDALSSTPENVPAAA